MEEKLPKCVDTAAKDKDGRKVDKVCGLWIQQPKIKMEEKLPKCTDTVAKDKDGRKVDKVYRYGSQR